MDVRAIWERIQAMPPWAKLGLGLAVLLVAFLGLRALSNRTSASGSTAGSSSGARLGGLPAGGWGGTGTNDAGGGTSSSSGSASNASGSTSASAGSAPSSAPSPAPAAQPAPQPAPPSDSPAPRYVNVTPWPSQDSTLSGIAADYNVHGGWQSVWALNPWIKDPNLIHPGDQVRIA